MYKLPISGSAKRGFRVYADVCSPQCLGIEVLPNPRSKTFTLFSTKTCEARWCGHLVHNMSIDYYVIKFDGQVVQQNTFMIPLPAETTELAGASITSIHPVDRNGGYRISVFCRYNHDGTTHMFHFDEGTQKFSQPEQQTRSGEDVRTAWWKDSFYQIHVRETVQTRSVCFYLDHVGLRCVCPYCSENRRHGLFHGCISWRRLVSLLTALVSRLLQEPSLTRNSGQDPKRTSRFHDDALLDDMDGGTDIALSLNDRFAVVQAFKRLYVFSFAEKAMTADHWAAKEPGWESENEDRLVLWEVPRHTW